MLQAAPTLLLAITIAVYGYVQPYKSMFTNILELILQVDFLILVLLWGTPYITEEYFVFEPSPITSGRDECARDAMGIAEVTWILMPILYLPLIILLVVLIAVVVKALTW